MEDPGHTTAEAVVDPSHAPDDTSRPITGPSAAPPLTAFLRNEIETGLRAALQWTVAQPNNEETWSRVRGVADELLNRYFRAGQLKGTSPAQAYFVRCDRSIMTQNDLNNGRLIVLIGIATVKPAEFVILRIGLAARKP